MVRPLLIRWPIDWQSGGPNPRPLLSVKETQTDIYISCFFMTGWRENGCHRSWHWGAACKVRQQDTSSSLSNASWKWYHICNTEENRTKVGNRIRRLLGKWCVILMSARLCCIKRTLFPPELPQHKPARCKQDKSPNLVLSVLTYWAETEGSTVVDKAPSYPNKPQWSSTS